MPEHRSIVLVTQNARFHHMAFGLHYLHANLGELRDQAIVLEFPLKDEAREIAERILQYKPQIVGLSVYVWNMVVMTRLAHLLKDRAPHVRLIVGGPEVSYEHDSLDLCSVADWTISGEGELSFFDLCCLVLSGRPPQTGVIQGRTPDLTRLQLPYSQYSSDDLALRTTYVETSRGCPYRCEFCLSSLDTRVRYFPLEPLLRDLDALMSRGATHLKFVDRTFNTDPKRAFQILEFLLKRWHAGMFFHFEIVAEHLSGELKTLLERFEPGALQLEVGVQTFNPDVAKLIGRGTDYAKLEANLTWLRSATSAHIHADLIAGLPGEDLTSFASGFDRLFLLSPHEIQIGLLKRLKGTAISRHAERFELTFSPGPPYEILSTKHLSAEEIVRLKRMARFFDLIWNSGRFPCLSPFIPACSKSSFDAFADLAERLYEKFGRTHSIDRSALRDGLADYLVQCLPEEKQAISSALESEREIQRSRRQRSNGHSRQQRHAANLRNQLTARE